MIPQAEPWLGAAEQEAVARVLARNWLSEGPESQAFSEGLNALIGASYGVFAPNGTLALVLGLMALGIGPGDEVIVPDITFIGSANAVLMVGARPVFVDVEKRGFQIDVERATTLVTNRTRAVMPVHLYGSACDMDAVVDFANRNDLRIIEDAAQGIGVRHSGRHVGSIGDVGCFSFFSDKTLTTGEGGYVVCRDADIHAKLRLLRNQGRLDRGSYIHPAVGYNFRITDLQAAVGLAQLQKLPEIIRRKLELHAFYEESLRDIPEVRILKAESHSTFVPFRCVVMGAKGEGLIQRLISVGVQARTFFFPLHRQPCFRDLPPEMGRPPSLADAHFPNSIHGFENGVCLPIFPGLECKQIQYIADQIRDFYGRSG